MKGGDGPESFSLYSPNLTTLTARLSALRLEPKNDGEIVAFSQAAFAHQLFFADREPSPTDRPEYFEHPNSAYHLEAIYLAASLAERRLLTALGATARAVRVCAPFAPAAEVFAFRDGTVFAIPSTAQTQGTRSIVGALVLVHDMQAARTTLQRNHIEFRSVADCGPRTIWVRPSDAQGLWLGFRE